MVLQPSDERRRSGSHYTPRSLTEPIVRTTLQPILERFGENPTPEQILDLKVCDPAMGSGAFLVEACRQLGDQLVKAWHVHDRLPSIPPDEDEVLHARRLIAQRCLYGVDKNPMAVDLAKLSLWLATLAKDHPFTFLDHSLRCGDSLVGLSRDQIIRFHWKPDVQRALSEDLIRKRVERATEYRRKILETAEGTPYLLLQQQLALADEALLFVRFVGDAAVSAFFSEATDRARQNKRDELFSKLSAWVSSGLAAAFEEPLAEGVKSLRSGERPVEPFHWEIEFPEVMARENNGFDAILGNPPFLGAKRTSTVLGDSYLAFLLENHPQSHGNSDVVAHFFRRAFHLIGKIGCFGLVATNTISQGDTRGTGLRFIRRNGGTIYHAQRRLRWPGSAAVVVSVVHVAKGIPARHLLLNNKAVAVITAFLFHTGGDDDPAPLAANSRHSFLGFKIYGQGFLFDDTDPDATPISVMEQLIAADPKNNQVIQPYLAGEDLNTSPTQSPHRFVINFGHLSEEEAARWPDLFAIVREKVRPVREGLKRDSLRTHWWQFGERQPALAAALAGMSRALVIARVSRTGAFAFVPAKQVLNEKIVVFTLEQMAAFAVLQSRVHDVWARFFNTTLKDDMQYTPSDCFETFPFPESWQTLLELEKAGNAYHDFRAAIMVRCKEGLTKTYNRFHDPSQTDADILTLRELHAAMDRTVLDAYGWTDLQPTCEFLLDYEEAEDDESQGHHRKKPWRYRWPDDFREEVLARLIELNKQRAEEDRLFGMDANSKVRSRKKLGIDSESTGHGSQPALSGL